MFYSLSGIYKYSEPGFAVIDCGGVGFKCLTTASTLRDIGSIGDSVMLYTFLNVREDALDLFGFSTETELACFRKILAVSGVGPKLALSVLSAMSPEMLALNVATGNSQELTKISGVGSKTAQRIVLELKDKLNFVKTPATAQVSVPSAAVDVAMLEDALSALTALGFSKNEAAAAASKCSDAGSVEEIIRRSLKLLSK